MDGLHIVAIGIPNEAAVVPGAVPPLLRFMQHLGAPRARHLYERVDLRPRSRPEGDVNVFVGPTRCVDRADPKVGPAVGTAEADMISIDEKCLPPEGLQHSLVEGPASSGVCALNRHVSKHAPTVQRRGNGGYLRDTAVPTSRPTSWAADHVSMSSIFGVPAVGDERSYGTGSGILCTPHMTREWGLPQGLARRGRTYMDRARLSIGSRRAVCVWLDVEAGDELLIASSFDELLNSLRPDAEFDADV